MRCDRLGPVECPHACRQPEQPQHLLVDRCLLDPAVTDGGDELLTPRTRGSGHNQVERGVGSRLGGPGCVPVGHDDPIEAPLLLEDLPEHGVLGHGGAVDAVVSGHDCPRPGLMHDHLERGEVELAQGALVDSGVEGEALGLGVVGHEMLDRSAHPAGLHAPHVGGADPGG
jgi:hypothetical protein